VDVLRELDREYPIERFDKYFTFIYMLIDIRRGALRYSNAGHPPPLLIRTDGTLEKLEKGGPMIGLGGVLFFEEGELGIRTGDRIILYTDGVLEYEKTLGESYGEKRFQRAVTGQSGLSIDALLDHIMEDMMAFGQQAKPKDDITLLGIEYRGAED
jgi:sigma-B regulation protein RsbU (phosphoserine phosphatase)